jgi:hypothetical protein
VTEKLLAFLEVHEVQELLEEAPCQVYQYLGRDEASGKPIYGQYTGTVEGDWHTIQDKADGPEDWNVPGLGVVKLVENYGGEGQGDDYWMVISVSDGYTTRLFRMNGYHVSHDGSYYDGPFEEVQAKKKMVTVYE